MVVHRLEQFVYAAHVGDLFLYRCAHEITWIQSLVSQPTLAVCVRASEYSIELRKKRFLNIRRYLNSKKTLMITILKASSQTNNFLHNTANPSIRMRIR